MTDVVEDFRTLFCDPGEDFGWCLGRGTKLIAAGTEKMRDFEDVIWDALIEDDNLGGYIIDPEAGGFLRDEALDECDLNPGDCKIGRIVMENFRLYPWALKRLQWNEVRTARVIGAIQLMARKRDIPCILQPAAIKAAAQAAGAESLYYEPHHENRHQNDAIQHFVFYRATEFWGLHLPVPKETESNG
jgi:hypothetical protein